MALTFQAEVWPIPISVSPTHADFLPAEMAWPIRPDTFSSFVVYDDYFKRRKRSRRIDTNLDIECCIEAHLQMTLIILIEQAQEALLEN